VGPTKKGYLTSICQKKKKISKEPRMEVPNDQITEPAQRELGTKAAAQKESPRRVGIRRRQRGVGRKFNSWKPSRYEKTRWPAKGNGCRQGGGSRLFRRTTWTGQENKEKTIQDAKRTNTTKNAGLKRRCRPEPKSEGLRLPTIKNTRPCQGERKKKEARTVESSKALMGGGSEVSGEGENERESRVRSAQKWKKVGRDWSNVRDRLKGVQD